VTFQFCLPFPRSDCLCARRRACVGGGPGHSTTSCAKTARAALHARTFLYAGIPHFTGRAVRRARGSTTRGHGAPLVRAAPHISTTRLLACAGHSSDSMRDVGFFALASHPVPHLKPEGRNNV